MFQLSLPQRRSLTISAVADDLATLEGLQRYLQPRVSFRAVPALKKAFASLAASDAVVFYPDGFSTRGVQRFVRQLLDNATVAVVIIVTACPEQFRGLSDASATADRFIVLSRPAWPWELFATIQATLPRPRREDAHPC